MASTALSPNLVNTLVTKSATTVTTFFGWFSTATSMHRRAAGVLGLAALLVALPYAPAAEARGGHHGQHGHHGHHGGHRAGLFIGGVVLGAVLAPRYVYSAPYYYYPPQVTYVQPPQVTYVQPPVVIHQAPPAAPAPQQAAANPQNLNIEDRLRRLRSMCEQGLFTAGECQSRREQLLQEM